MKKRKILLLIPFAGLILSGCTFQDGISWIGQNIYTPVKDWISNLINPGKKDEEKKDEEKGGGEEGGGEEEVETVIGSIENPLSASEFCTKADELIDFSQIQSGKSETCTNTLIFVEGRVTSSSAMSQYGEIEYLNMVDKDNNEVAIVGHFTLVDSSITDDYSEQNSLQSKIVVVKGYACLFNHSTKGKTYQLAKKDNDHKPTVVKVTDGEPTPGVNYGTLENPLTTSEAYDLLDSENPSKSEMYVGGTVVSNTAWSTKYNNMDIVITDGQKEFTIFRTATLPSGYTKESVQANEFEGYTLVAAGIGKIYTKDDVSTYELDQGCVVMSLVAPEAKSISEVVNVEGPEEVGLNHVWSTSEVTVTVLFEGDNEPSEAKVLSVEGDTDVAGENFEADVTIEGWNETLHFTYAVTGDEEEPEPGTAERPYTVAEARAAATATVATDKYVSGIIYKVESFNATYKSLTYWISDDGTGDHTQKDGLQIYSGKGLEGADFAGVDDLSVGDEVVIKGDLKLYNSTTYEIDKNSVIISRNVPEVQDITLTGTAQSEYTIGVNYNHSGLVVKAQLSNGVEADVTAKAEWTYNGQTTLEVGENDTTVRIAASYAGFSKYVDVAVTVSAPSGQTETVTIDYDHKGDITTTAGEQTYTTTDGKLTIVISNGVANANNSDIRVYKDATITFTAQTEVSSIAFTCSSSNGAENFDDIEGFVKSAPNGTWTGNLKTVTFTASAKQVRITQLVVSYK